VFFYLSDNQKSKVSTDKDKDELLDDIMYNGLKLMRHKMALNSEKQESCRIYATDQMLDTLLDKNYKQFFIDGTFKCVPKGIIFSGLNFFLQSIIKL
jgi:inorganic pyrophosphatase/exopolyphosphatase